uniref:Uncharacterized protein n=1 Tax=Picea glauca TaxID=3330 RepID=A0A101LUZ5_PICGL|nr:hypothetical protein ABT39_MTgene2208 [Picea glauca]
MSTRGPITLKVFGLRRTPYGFKTRILRAYDGFISQPEGLYQNVPIELEGKMVLIDIEVVDAPLDYNILLGRSYMYAMKAVSSLVFRTMMFPHAGKEE